MSRCTRRAGRLTSKVQSWQHCGKCRVQGTDLELYANLETTREQKERSWRLMRMTLRSYRRSRRRRRSARRHGSPLVTCRTWLLFNGHGRGREHAVHRASDRDSWAVVARRRRHRLQEHDEANTLMCSELARHRPATASFENRRRVTIRWSSCIAGCATRSSTWSATRGGSSSTPRPSSRSGSAAAFIYYRSGRRTEEGWDSTLEEFEADLRRLPWRSALTDVDQLPARAGRCHGKSWLMTARLGLRWKPSSSTERLGYAPAECSVCRRDDT